MEHSGHQTPNPEAERLLEIAHKLLLAGDLVGAKCFAERALESSPLLAGIDQILAIADVLLASQRRLNNQPDWYSILQLPHPPSSPSPTSSDIKRGYRHLSLLLSPAHNNLPYADAALRNVFEAYSFLSDPAKKSLYNLGLGSDCPINVINPRPPRSSFWTFCDSCCHVFEYDRVYVDRTLRCGVCMRAFRGAEMKAAPHIVPGTDMYYCAWGVFPLGFPGSGLSNLGFRDERERPLDAVPVNVAAGKPSAEGGKRSAPTRNRKVVAKKRVGNCVEKRDLFGETDSEVEGVEMGGGRAGTAGNEEGEGINNFEIDLEATEDLLSNLHDLPFVV